MTFPSGTGAARDAQEAMTTFWSTASSPIARTFRPAPPPANSFPYVRTRVRSARLPHEQRGAAEFRVRSVLHGSGAKSGCLLQGTARQPSRLLQRAIRHILLFPIRGCLGDIAGRQECISRD